MAWCVHGGMDFGVVGWVVGPAVLWCWVDDPAYEPANVATRK